MEKLDKNSKVLIGTFAVWDKNRRVQAISGMIEPLLNFFCPRVSRVDLIDGPHPGSSQVISLVEIHQKGKRRKDYSLKTARLLSPLLKIKNTSRTQIIFKIRDLLATLEWGLISGQKYQLFIGLESIYTLMAIFLKKLGKVEAVVYYVSDFSPNRYPQKWFNKLYLWLDRFCAMHADFIWDVSEAMHPARIKAGLDPKKSAPDIHAPNAPNTAVEYKPLAKLKPLSLVYAGGFGSENGIDLAIKAMPRVIKKIPKANLHIYGWPPEIEKKLKKLTRELRVEKNVFFHGFINGQAKLSRHLRQYQLALAPYRATPGSHRWYADAIKIRHYLSCGLPIITTPVPPLGKEVVKAGAGLIAKDNEKEFAKAIIKMLEKKTVYHKARQAAIAFIKDNTWENTYTNALKKMRMF
jgi:glycosyltransferase involved in cell wall biosynthesis